MNINNKCDKTICNEYKYSDGFSCRGKNITLKQSRRRMETIENKTKKII
jgi:hypothetical protein